MKGILILILAAAVGYVAYSYVYPPLAEAMKYEKHKPKQEVVAKPEPKKEVKIEPPKPVEEPKPEPMPEPKPQMAVVPEPMPEPKPQPKPGEFVPPEFPPLEVAVNNWTAIPKSAFPRQVKMKKDLELKMKMGNATAGTQIKAGGLIMALGQDGTMLIVAPTETSPMRGQVPLEDTDMKEILTDVYERWKVARVETLRRQHEYKLAEAARPKTAPKNAAGAKGAASNDKPTKDKDGTYPLLLSSMKSGQVTEIKPDAIKEWGEPALEDGIWKVNVKYETQTMFGKFDTEAQAQIKDGKVEKWIYTGSGELVP